MSYVPNYFNLFKIQNSAKICILFLFISRLSIFTIEEIEVKIL